jgi:cytochrome P450
MESLAAEVPVFVLAGFETTAHGLSFAFGLLALHPELADQIAQEGRAVEDKLVVDDDDVATELIRQALEQAPTARRFFLEMLRVRLYPLVPTLPGKCLQDVTVTTSQGEVYGLPQGTQVLFTNFVLNRQQAGEALTSSLWERPPEEQPFTNTFNTGAHICPGKALSLLEARVFLLMAAIQFEFIIPREHKENPMDFMDHIMLKPKEGMPLLIRERAFN